VRQFDLAGESITGLPQMRRRLLPRDRQIRFPLGRITVAVRLRGMIDFKR
jgi:hypothetical protein